MPNKRRAKKKEIEERTLRVDAALDQHIMTKKKICEAADIKLSDLNNLFTHNRELYAKYTVLRRTITDIASDNVAEIVNDPHHPQHFQASKYVLEKFRSDFNETLDKNDDELIVNVDGMESSAGSSVSIVFSK